VSTILRRMNSILPPPPPLNYEFRARPFRGKPPIFDGQNFEFYREELSLWMKKNFSIDWTLTTDDAVRNNRKPTEPQTEYCDQEHAWDAIFTGCKHIQDLKPILQLTVRGTKHMQFASFVWKDIEVFYNPETPSALRNKKLRWKEAAADFSGDISHYKARVRAALSNLGQHAPSNDKIIMRMLTGIMSSPVARDWSEFVKESCSELQSNNSDVHDFFKRAELYSKIHEDFQHTTESVKLNPSQPRPTAPIYPGIEDPSYTEASSAAASNNTEVQSNTTTNKSKRDRDFKEHSKEDKTTSPPAKRRRQRRRPPKHVRLQNRASAERAEDHEDRRSDEHSSAAATSCSCFGCSNKLQLNKLMPRGVPFSMLLKCPSSTRCTFHHPVSAECLQHIILWMYTQHASRWERILTTWLMSGTKNTSNFLRSPSCTRQSSTVLQQHACTSTTLCSKASTITCRIFDSQSRSGGNGWEIQRCTHMTRTEPSSTKRGRALYL